jgi:FkbM family methyltransferase
MRHSDLVFDVGLHHGDDTIYYLSLGYRVVAFEADPANVAICETRFADALADGRLRIVVGAIADPRMHPDPTVTFYRHEGMSFMGSIEPDWYGAHDRRGHQSGGAQELAVTAITVPRVDFAHVLRTYGVPYYLKVDIEGADYVCLDALRTQDAKPAYVSCETTLVPHAEAAGTLRRLRSLGYREFQAVNQARIPVEQQSPLGQPFPEMSSGLFGRDLPDIWMSAASLAAKYRLVGAGLRLAGTGAWLPQQSWRGAYRLSRLMTALVERVTAIPIPGWYDTHARHHTAD